MSEKGYVELPVIGWLTGHPDPQAPGLGWTYRDEAAMAAYPNVEKALGVEDLKGKLRSGWRGTLITTIQSFQQMADLAPIERDDVICLIDECHRTQKGGGR